MDVKVIGEKNNCEHVLKSIDGNIKWCTKCGMIQVDIYDTGYVMIRREHHYPEVDKKEKES